MMTYGVNANPWGARLCLGVLITTGFTFNTPVPVSMETQDCHSHIVIRILQPRQILESFARLISELLGGVGVNRKIQVRKTRVKIDL
jgi:hypothetical protein